MVFRTAGLSRQDAGGPEEDADLEVRAPIRPNGLCYG
jgi:hypothetical protein